MYGCVGLTKSIKLPKAMLLRRVLLRGPGVAHPQLLLLLLLHLLLLLLKLLLLLLIHCGSIARGVGVLGLPLVLPR